MGEINFLCANKNLRAKKLAPILISEVTRRINQKDKWQAVKIFLM
jgi:glycylpeptide N-tetradecanoyltransferase